MYFENCKQNLQQRHSLRSFWFSRFFRSFRQNINIFNYLSLESRELHTPNCAPNQSTVWSRSCQFKRIGLNGLKGNLN